MSTRTTYGPPLTARDTPSAVTYVGLPISSGGAHSLGRTSRRAAYERTVAFLGACTQPIAPIEYRFGINLLSGLVPVPDLREELKRRFGQYGQIKAERVSDALDFLDDIYPQRADRWGVTQICFVVSSRFRILDPTTGQPLPGQDPARFQGVQYEWDVPLGTSSLRLTLENHASLGIELCIPDANYEVLGRVVPSLQEHLPFRFSPKQWRLWTRTKAGSYMARRMAPPAVG